MSFYSTMPDCNTTTFISTKISYAMYNNKISWLQHLFYRLTHWANCANTGVVKCLYLGNTQMTLCNEECSLSKTLS